MDTSTPARRTGPRAWVRSHQLLAYVALAYALSWWAWFWYRADPENVGAPILPAGPLIAALLILAVVGGWPAIADLLRRIVRWRVAWYWYALVLGAPVAFTLLAYWLNLSLGATLVADYRPAGAGRVAFVFLFIFFWIGLGEEPGWRGFALPRLLERHTALTASLILGAIHAVWHLPLLGVEYFPSNLLPWALSVFAFSIVICWVFLHTGGSVLLPMLMHASNNAVASVIWRRFEGADQVRLWWLWVAFWIALAAAVVLIAGRDLARGRPVAP